MVSYKEGDAPAFVLVSECSQIESEIASPMEIIQFWDLPDAKERINDFHYQITLSDFMARKLPYKQRCGILAQWLDIVLDTVGAGECSAILFKPSGRLLTPKIWQENPNSDQARFLHGGINARYFNIQGTDDMIVDT